MSYTGYNWVEFKNGQKFSVSGTTDVEVKQNLDELNVENQRGADVVRIDSLPYPGAPILGHVKCPPFCDTPDKCKGRTSCPKNYACSE